MLGKGPAGAARGGLLTIAGLDPLLAVYFSFAVKIVDHDSFHTSQVHDEQKLSWLEYLLKREMHGQQLQRLWSSKES